jgi:hypothetical protein
MTPFEFLLLFYLYLLRSGDEHEGFFSNLNCVAYKFGH